MLKKNKQRLIIGQSCIAKFAPLKEVLDLPGNVHYGL